MPTSVAWRDLTLSTGIAAPYRITAIEGWEELPGSRYDDTPRSRGHGSHPSAVYAEQRIVTVEGFTRQAGQRDALLAALRSRVVFGGEEPLAVTLAGRTLTASAQILAARPVLTAGRWGIDEFGWLLQWRCPDPLRYGSSVTVTTGLPSAGTGVAYPLAYPLDYGTLGATGQLVLTNGGTADTPIVFDVTGPLPSGFELSSSLGRLVYPMEVPAGQVLTIDTATGTVLVEGTADRRANLTVADWLHVPAGASLTVQFTSLGGAYSAAASAAATVRDAHW